jgi:hypothetical protein
MDLTRRREALPLQRNNHSAGRCEEPKVYAKRGNGSAIKIVHESTC